VILFTAMWAFASTVEVLALPDEGQDYWQVSGPFWEDGEPRFVLFHYSTSYLLGVDGSWDANPSFPDVYTGGTVESGHPVALPASLVPNGAADVLYVGHGFWRLPDQIPMVRGVYGPYELAGDVDGNGTLDVCTSNGVALTSLDTWSHAPYPRLDLGSGFGAPHRACGADYTGDGHADLLVGARTDGGYLFFSYGGPVALFPGGPDGFSYTPTWVVDELFFDAPYSMVAVQRDDDPELELAALTRPMSPYGKLQGSTLVLLDDVATDPHRDGAYPTFADRGDEGLLEAQLVNLGDVDGDGYDDLAIPEGRGYGYETTTLPIHHIRIVSSASDGAVVDELGTLRFDVGEADPVDSMWLGVADLNEDGETDLYGLACWRDCFVQVWYGPLAEHLEEPADTGGTGDTGASTETASDTGGTASPTADTASSPTAPASPGPTETQGCGCATGRSSRWRWLGRRP